jgi:hypothetical protein
VINVLLGSGRWRENQNSPSQGLNATTLGFSPQLVSQFQAQTYPGFSMQGYASLNNRRFLNVPRETHNLQVNLTKELGAHSLKFGWLGEAARLNNTDFNTPAFNFTRGLTSGPVAAVARRCCSAWGRAGARRSALARRTRRATTGCTSRTPGARAGS